MRVHNLKTDPQIFDRTWQGVKNFEVRWNDRDFQVGDLLILEETKHTGHEMKERGFPLKYTGRSIVVKVTYLMKGPVYGLQNGWVIMAIKELNRNNEEI